MKLSPFHLIKVAFLAYLPVIATILVMIVLRANDLARENNDAGLGQSFFNPTTPEQAIVAGFTIWILGAFFVAVLAIVLYHVLRTRTHRGPITFLTITLVLSLIIAVGAYQAKILFAPEAAFEVLTCGIGYGVLIPIFYARERDRLMYGPGSP
jgi:hypothetical protein